MPTNPVTALSFLTWNLAMLARSAQAPAAWGQENTEFAVRQRVLATEPDLVLFQELPRMVPYIDTHDMIKANPESHQGNLATLVSHQLLAEIGEPAVTVVPGCAVLITLPMIGSDDGTLSVTVANVHLSPGPGAAARSDRLDQLARIVEASPTSELAIVGDTNTRVDELSALADAGLAAPRPPKSTWNSRRNRFNRSGPEFTAFFTRCFVTAGLDVTGQKVHDAPEEIDGRRFHLSDHYALSGKVINTEAGLRQGPSLEAL